MWLATNGSFFYKLCSSSQEPKLTIFLSLFWDSFSFNFPASPSDFLFVCANIVAMLPFGSVFFGLVVGAAFTIEQFLIPPALPLRVYNIKYHHKNFIVNIRNIQSPSLTPLTHPSQWWWRILWMTTWCQLKRSWNRCFTSKKD